MSDTLTGRLISLTLTDSQALRRYYLWFIQGGGIFIPCRHDLALGSPVCLVVRFAHTDQVMALNTRVVWITPAHAQRGRPQGIGVQFVNPSRELVLLIDPDWPQQPADPSEPLITL